MPYRKRKRGDVWVIVKITGGKQRQVGKHNSEAKADKQLTALRIAESRENNG